MAAAAGSNPGSMTSVASRLLPSRADPSVRYRDKPVPTPQRGSLWMPIDTRPESDRRKPLEMLTESPRLPTHREPGSERGGGQSDRLTVWPVAALS